MLKRRKTRWKNKKNNKNKNYSKRRGRSKTHMNYLDCMTKKENTKKILKMSMSGHLRGRERKGREGGGGSEGGRERPFESPQPTMQIHSKQTLSRLTALGATGSVQQFTEFSWDLREGEDRA